MEMRRYSRKLAWLSLGLTGVQLAVGCGGDEDGTAADRAGIAAECASDEQCPEARRGDDTIALQCIRQFRGGYCGIADCQQNDDCPDGSRCVSHDDGTNYCFRECTQKLECNRNRTPANEANCSSNIDFVEATAGKACVPPSSGT
jgi:hypothetical protein